MRAKRPRILIVDDQEMLRSILKAVLVKGGYDVSEARDGGDAVAQCGSIRDGERFDLVLMDVHMPNLSGKEASERILQIDPTTRILFLSGALGDGIGDWLETVHFLQKPFDNQELLTRVGELVGNS